MSLETTMSQLAASVFQSVGTQRVFYQIANFGTMSEPEWTPTNLTTVNTLVANTTKSSGSTDGRARSAITLEIPGTVVFDNSWHVDIDGSRHSVVEYTAGITARVSVARGG